MEQRTNIESVASEEVIPVSDRINQELIKHNLTEAVLVELEKTAATLEINGVTDKEGYENVNRLRIAAKNTRVLTTKVCKSLREDSIAFQKQCIKTEKEITERIAKVEEDLAAKQKIVDDIKAEEKRKKDEVEQKLLQERSVNLIKFGMNFTGDAYVLDDIRISVISVKTSDEFTWSSLTAAVERKFQEKEAIRLQEERLKEEAALAAKALADENLKKQEELRKQQEELEAKQRALAEAEAKQKAEAERLIKEREEAEKRAKDELLKSRKSTLFSLGFSQQNQRLVFKDVFFLESEIVGCSEEEWAEKVRITTANVEHIKKEIERLRIVELEKAKADAIEAERKRVELENIAKAQLAEQARLEEQRRKEAEDLENARIAAMAPDITKLNSFLKTLADVPVPEFTSDSYKEFGSKINEMRTQFLMHIHSKKPA